MRLMCLKGRKQPEDATDIHPKVPVCLPTGKVPVRHPGNEESRAKVVCAQVCSIDLVVGDLERRTVALLPHLLAMEQDRDMTLFTITDISWSFRHPGEPSHGLNMVLVLKRKITSEMMTTYFPSALLMLITYATTFFKPYFFEAALSVNLTTMLVMTTIFISKMEGLPTTSYTKMIDFWLILCQLVPFIEVVLITAAENLRDDTEDIGKRSFEFRSKTSIKTSLVHVSTNDITRQTPPAKQKELHNGILQKLTVKDIGRFYVN